MDLSPDHISARQLAVRIPALQASLARLVGDASNRSRIEYYGTARPVAGDPPGGAAIVVMPLSATAGTVHEPSYQLRIDAPIEAQVTGADPATGTVPIWARVYDPAGAWWGDVSVTAEGGGGDIQLVPTGSDGGVPVARYFNGAFARLSSFVFQG